MSDDRTQTVDRAGLLQTGERLGPYLVQGLIGKGGMGEVYRAEDMRLGRLVAVKVLPIGLIDRADRLRRFELEARATAALNHPNICAVYDVGTHHGQPYIVMEHLEGESMAAMLKRVRRAGQLVPLDDVVRWGLECAEALRTAHAHDIVHRDVKPGNLVILSSGSVKVLDFGLAKQRISPEAETVTDSDAGAITASGAVVGSPRYMSPEQAAGQPLDHRSDLFSLGAVMYELLCGRAAFSGGTRGDVMAAVMRDEPRAPATLRPDVPAELDRIVSKALAKSRDDRYQTAEALCADLRALQHPRRSRAWWSAALVAAAAVLVAAVWLSLRGAAGPASQVDDAGRMRIAVVTPRNLTGQQAIDGWPAVAQILLVDELTGVEKLSIFEPESLNTLLSPDHANTPPLVLLKQEHVPLALLGDVVVDGGSFALRARLVDTATGNSRFSTTAPVAGEAALIGASRAIAQAVLIYLQLETPAGDQDLRPWILSRHSNLDAVKAFLRANEDIYQARGEAEQYLEQSVALDPDFVAPRVWLAVELAGHGSVDQASAHYEHLKQQLPTASPFERAMIEFTGARIRRNAADQERWLNAALGYSPGNNILLFQLAGLQVAGKHCDEAMRTMAPLVRMRWRYRNLYPLWGWCGVQTGRTREVLPVLRDASAFDAPSPRTFGVIEGIALSLGDAATAAEYRARFESSHQPPAVGNSLMPLFVRLADDCEARGAAADALALLHRAVALGPDQDLSAIRERIARLSKPR